MSSVSGLPQIKANMQQLSRKVRSAGAKSINKIARKAMSNATKSVAKDVGVPTKTVRGRSRLMTRATTSAPVARIRVNRANMPAIRLFEKSSNKLWVGRGGIVVGKYAIQRGFVQQLKNGHKHILQRKGKARYPIDVVKIPLAPKITAAYKKETDNYPQDLRQALAKELQHLL